MAKNGPKGKGRAGEVRKRLQAYNPRVKRWVKIAIDKGGHIIDQHAKKFQPFKGVKKV